jgi:hypothetical protein
MKTWLPKVSLREFLTIIAFVAVACGALMNASAVWVSVLASLTVVVGGAMLVVACVERGPRQAFAIGFVAFLGTYLLGVQFTGQPQNANPFGGGVIQGFTYYKTLPTTNLLAELWLRVRAPYYAIVGSFGPGEPFERYDGPLSDVDNQFAGTGRQNTKPPKQSPPPGSAGYALAIYPVLDSFLAVGHLLFAFLFGYLGGKFAVWAHARRVKREQAPQTSDNT